MKMFSNICLLSLSLSLQVFGTNVMVTVAKSFEAPIKCKYERLRWVLGSPVVLNFIVSSSSSTYTSGFIITSDVL